MDTEEFSNISTAFDTHWQEETTEICKLNTIRLNSGKLNPNVLKVRDYIFQGAEDFNINQNSVKFTSFQWCQTNEKDNYQPNDDEILEADYAVFGLKFGSDTPKYKMVVICHLDTVPADSESTVWNPFEPTIEHRKYSKGSQGDQDFLVGRGCVDDKGPAISAFIAARSAAKACDGTSMNDVQIEVLFDSSEETDMSTPHYLEGDQTEVPDFGIVYDAFWNTRAEKGAERPVFYVNPKNYTPPTAVHIHSLISSPENSVNTIPDYCDAVFKGSDAGEVANLASTIESLYMNDAVFDDPNYRKAKMDPPVMSEDQLSFSVRTYVEGAQHGSAPEENREEGANPLVSLANFVNWMLDNGNITGNYVSTMCAFITSTWGTYVFGEPHESLYKYDEVFTKGNGTTYAVSKTEATDEGIQLSIDIRYAIPHHENPWDGVTEGFLPGTNSTFQKDFGDIIHSFNAKHPHSDDVTFSTSTIFAPDIRIPETNPYFQSVETSFFKVMGHNAPRFAIGGGTDAKGYTFLCGAGPLFNPSMGYPINYHGLNEGAPMADMKKSTEIIYQSIMDQIQSPIIDSNQDKPRVRKAIHELRHRRQKTGYKMRCSH